MPLISRGTSHPSPAYASASIRALTVGAFYQALLSGLAAQAMADLASVPSGRDLLDAVRTVAARLGAGETGTRTG